MGFLDRLFGKNVPAPQAAPPASDAALAELRRTAQDAIIPGFRDFDEVVQQVQDVHELDDAATAEAVVREVWAERRRVEEGWPSVTEGDRLRTAFAILEARGFVARADFTCCNTCGTAEIDDERTPAPNDETGAPQFREWAYTFFHQQDAERLAEEPAHLFLTFSAFAPLRDLDPGLLAAADVGDEAARSEVWRQTDARVGRIVADALAEAGLPVEWDGDPAHRIVIPLPQWRNRLPGTAPATA
ncbi:hypothetical protein DEU35_3061 [Microbacterium sp. AG157]|uniref:DUF6891 domain-containing protein n=1 Tax=Microbacterium sp. AG157 TaxID=2183993 RepID=UPI000E3831C7|nr:hypothetical protein [Microbacterium sp. AG157]REC97295.1 hypothetical protein DEU35_3061 [Microbacterium sp. AG157]